MIIPFTLLADAASGQSTNILSTPIIPLLCFVVIFYFMILRPQSKQKKELQDRVSALKTGDKVVTSSGIHGIIANVKEGNTLLLKIADNVKIEIDKSAIATVEKSDKPEKADKAPATTTV